MSRTLLHDWECSIEKNKNNTEELLRLAEDIYNTAYARGKASEERPQGKWKSLMWVSGEVIGECPFCGGEQVAENYCSYCGARLHGRN